MTSSHVVVIGGGYSGVTAANRLTQRDDITVTLINPRPMFVERIRLHQLVGGSDDATVDYADVLAPAVSLVVDTATLIDPASQSVSLASGQTENYDYLIYAAGSGSADATVPGAQEFAYPIASLEQAQRLRAALKGTVTVVGAGPTGIETAAELAADHDVTLVCDVLGPYLHPRARKAVAKDLRKLGVTVLEQVKVTTVGEADVELSNGQELPSTTTIWTAGFGTPDLATRSGLSTDDIGRLRTDETLTSIDDPRIVAAGDSAAPSGRPFRMSCQAAGPLGAHAADTVISRLDGTAPAPLAMAFVGQCISLGRGRGLVQISHRDDTASRLYLRGALAAKMKELVCRGTVWQLGLEARRPGLVTVPRWAADKSRSRQRQEVGV